MTGPPGRSTGNAAPARRPHVALARGGATAAAHRSRAPRATATPPMGSWACGVARRPDRRCLTVCGTGRRVRSRGRHGRRNRRGLDHVCARCFSAVVSARPRARTRLATERSDDLQGGRVTGVDFAARSPIFHHVTKTVMKSPQVRPRRKRRCAWCRGRMRQNKRGRPKVYCSASCRQRGYEARRAARQPPARLLDQDIETMKTKAGIERAVVDILRKFGVLPPAPKRPPPLRLIDPTDDD